MEKTERTCWNEVVSDVYWDGVGSKSGFPRLVQAEGKIASDIKSSITSR
jgi:hypothetical protein